jgi:hypothetical protein
VGCGAGENEMYATAEKIVVNASMAVLNGGWERCVVKSKKL